jgi:hypothetical protein
MRITHPKNWERDLDHIESELQGGRARISSLLSRLDRGPANPVKLRSGARVEPKTEAEIEAEAETQKPIDSAMLRYLELHGKEPDLAHSTLTICSPGMKPWEFDMQGRDLWIIGRKHADIDLSHDVQVTPRHAAISLVNHHWMLQDLNSHTGTFLNGGLLMEPEMLEYGDDIEIGNTHIWVGPHVEMNPRKPEDHVVRPNTQWP